LSTDRSESAEGRSSTSIRVVLGVREPLVRAGLRLLIEQAPDMVMVADVGDAAGLRGQRADVCVCDVALVADGNTMTQLVSELRPSTVLALVHDPEPPTVVQLLAAGASVIGMRDPDIDLLTAIRATAQGLSVLTERPVQAVLEQVDLPAATPSNAVTPHAAEGMGELTPRELEVLEVVATGLSNAAIAELLIVSEATVKTHVGNVLAKLGATHRAEIVMLAYESGLVRPGDGNAPAGAPAPKAARGDPPGAPRAEIAGTPSATFGRAVGDGTAP
jgi:DNA-binding NarL/FixJ family response regulator